MYQVNKYSNRQGLAQDRDPDIWEPPSQSYDKYGKPVQKKRSESLRPNYQPPGRGLNFVRQVRGTNGDAIARRKEISNKYSLQGANPAALNGKKGYNPGGKKSKVSSGNQSQFLLHHYPDGTGPDQELIKMLEKDMLDKNPNVGFGDIAQLKDAKTVLQEAVLLPLAMPQYFQGIRRPWKGVLLFGPPGTGKTMLAKALATQGKTRFFNVSASSLASKWRGDGQKLVRLLFEMARFYAPTVLFFDEIDALASKRGGEEHQSSRRLKTELFVQIDGVCESNSTGADSQLKAEERKMVMVLGATNRPWDLDEAMIRRLEKRIYIPLPNIEGRKQLLKLNLKNVKIDQKEMSYDTLVKRTQNYSGADISNLCRQAAMMPMRDKLASEIDFENLKSLEDQINRPLRMKDFLQALKNVKRSVGSEYLGQYSKWFKQFGSV